MPPEPLPLDRKEFVYKDRKHDRGGGLPPGGADALAPPGASARWREPPHHHTPPPQPQPPPRDFSRSSPRRTPSGYYRQGGGGYDRLYPEDSGGHGYTPSRSDRYWPEDDGFRSFGRYGGGSRSCRDVRGSYRRSPYRSFSGDRSHQHQHQEHRQDPPASALRSVAVPISPASDRAIDGLGAGHGSDRDRDRDRERDWDRDRDHTPRATPWRPLLRRGSFGSSGKDGRSEATEAGDRVEASAGPDKEPSAQSLGMAPAAPQPAEEEAPRKKARLGWGQGLAKYEKQKVQGSAEAPLDNGAKDGPGESDAGQKAAEPEGFPSSAAAVPSSAPSSSSPVTEDKVSERTANSDVEPIKGTNPEVGIKDCNDEVLVKLDQLDGDPISALNAFLTDLLQHEDTCSGDSSFTRHTNMNKLLQLKGDISKELERTELKIDLLENELKSADFDVEPAHNNTQNPSLEPSDGALKSPTSAENHEIIPSLEKELGDPLPSPKGFFEQDAEVKDVEMKNVEMVPSNNEKAASSEERADCSDLGEMAHFSVNANNGEFIASEENKLQDCVGQECPEAVSCHGSLKPVNADGSGDFFIRSCSHDEANSNLISLIIAANKDAAKEASELLVKALPTEQTQFDLWGLNRVSDCKRNDSRIREKLVTCKHRLKFKEQVLAFKFRALHHLWKEDIRLLSVRKQRTKSNKRTDSGSRTSQSNSQKQRSSARSRFTLPASNLALPPTMEMPVVASKLLSEFQMKRYRNNLKMPALIIDDKEKRDRKFITWNGLVADPVSIEKERTMINPWTQEEKEIFMEMLAAFGKDFSKISTYLTHKTTADCIEFYYKNHKSESFREVKKHLDLRKQRQCLPTSTYLATSGKKWNPETNAASLEILGAASDVVARGLGCVKRMEKNSARSLIQSNNCSDIPYGMNGSSDREHCSRVSLHERESVAADVLAGICGTLSSEAMSSCVTSSVDPGEMMRFAEMERPLTPEVNQSFDDDVTCSDEECGEVDSVDWTDDEKSMFLQAVNKYGKDFVKISSCVKSRSSEQCKIFFSKARKSLGLDIMHQGTGDVGMPMSDANGGRSDTDEACVAEMDSAICSTQSCSKMDGDGSPSAADASIQVLILSGSSPNQPETGRSSEQDVVGGINLEGSDNKADKNDYILGDDKSQLVANQAASGPTYVNCNESIHIPQAAVNLCSETNMNDDNGMVPPSEKVATTSSEIRSHHDAAGGDFSAEAILLNDGGRGFSAEGSRKEVCSNDVAQSGSKTINMACGDSCTNSSGSLFYASETGAKENGVHRSDMAGVCPRPTISATYQQTVPTDLLPPIRNKQQVIPLSQKDFLPVQFNSVLPGTTSICFDSIASKTTFNFEDCGKKYRSSGAKELNQCPKDLSFNQHDVALHKMNGSALQMWNKKDVKRESDHLVTEMPHLQNGGKPSSSSLLHSITGMPLNQSSEEKTEAQLRPCSHRASTESEEQLHRPGDVKIFGKILSHQSSLQSSGSSSNDSKSKPPSPKIDRSATAKTLNNAKDSALHSSKPAISGHLGFEERPVRTYGYWDSSKIQTGISSLHESALMFAKYQRSLAGVPFYSAKNGTLSSNLMLAEYQQPFVQHLASDTKRLESFADLQRRNGIEVVSGFQQPGKSARLGGAGILVGGVSDPVAALKMHYASNAKVLSNDVEPWRGDVGGGR